MPMPMLNPNIKEFDFEDAFNKAKMGAMYAGGIFEAVEIASLLREKKGVVPFAFAMLLKSVKDLAWDKAADAAKDAIFENENYAADFFKEIAEDPESLIDELRQRLDAAGYDGEALLAQNNIDAILENPEMIDALFGAEEEEALLPKEDPRSFAAVDVSQFMSMGSYGSRIIDEAIKNGAQANIPIGLFKEHIKRKEQLNGIDRELEEELEREWIQGPSPA